MDSIDDIIRQRFACFDMGDEYTSVLVALALDRQKTMPGPAVSKPGSLFHAGANTSRLEKPDMHSLLSASDRLGTLPALFHSLVEIINTPNATAEDIAEVISMDPALMARLLRLVNSPFYGFASKVDSLSRAVVLVGTRQLVMLAMSATLIATFKGIPTTLLPMNAYWTHSISCGVAARLLARSIRAPQPDSFFAAGILHDIGRLLLYSQLPSHSLLLLTEARQQQTFVHQLEESILGFTHEELGAELLSSWNLPGELAQKVADHHQEVTPSIGREETIVATANVLSLALGYGTSGEDRALPISGLAWSKLGLSPASLAQLCNELEENMRILQPLLLSADQGF